jgi:hypothetical protein
LAAMPEDQAAPHEVELRALAHRAYEALNAHDLDAFLAIVTEDVEFTSLIAEAEGMSFSGRDGVRIWWDTVIASFEELHWDVLELITGTGSRGVVHVRIVGSIGGVRVEQPMWQAVSARDGKASWWALFRTKAEALEAAGISDPGDQ